jgi:hypothetical protein
MIGHVPHTESAFNDFAEFALSVDGRPIPAPSAVFKVICLMNAMQSDC